MHKEDLVIMFVSGPNMRTDFHLDESPEFFWQMKGHMELPIIERGQRKLVKINEGEVFLLPPRIPHAPQRPCPESLGLVVERQRIEGRDYDGLRWYTNFDKCDMILWERYFYCGNLERDVIPIVKEYQNSQEFATNTPSDRSVPSSTPFPQDTTTAVPRPFNLNKWLEAHAEDLAVPGTKLNLFGDDYPTKEFVVYILGAGDAGSTYQESTGESGSFLYLIRGRIEVTTSEGVKIATSGSCHMLPAMTLFSFKRSDDCVAVLLESHRSPRSI
ncbi:3-hydroxyanthranilic acid dioxygenase [Perkinsus olseni]|uniref:3-hydroxyanthranilic acid dioxygenase n=1 Tax=Perkinsus olseni TaxID=32597 RepID=A0A7J6P8L5_PEROL|nr:3-hydroxyanthranilic acid dioxygenase [Perkinsus olseni]